MFLQGESDFQFFVNGQQIWNGPLGCGDGKAVYQASTQSAPVPVRISWKIPSGMNSNVVDVRQNSFPYGAISYHLENAPPVGSATIPFIPSVTAEVMLSARQVDGYHVLLDPSGARQEMFCKFNGAPVASGTPAFPPGDGTIPGDGTGDGTTPPAVCVGTIVCNIPDMWVYVAGLLLVMAAVK